MLSKFLLSTTAVLLFSTHVLAAKPDTSEKTAKDDPYILMELFGAAFSAIKSDYVEETQDRKLIESAIDGMLVKLDPHSGFMDQESYDDMETQTKGEFGGLGIEVTAENGMIRIMTPIDDTPAFKAGLQPGDYITHIDGISVSGLSLNDAVKKMRGAPKTKVRLSIARKEAEPFDVTLTRDIIKIQPVKYEAKEDVGYIRIITFSETTTDSVKKAITELKKKIGENKIKGYVLDIRNNPGGLLDQAVGVSDLFLTQGEIVSTRSRNPEDTIRFSAKKDDLTNGAPIVVLINEGSASASEIVAGALQDHRRAVIVGLKSFGKGSVQSVKAIPGFGAIRLTTARYYKPSGNSIQAKGITPDVVIPLDKIEEEPIIQGFAELNLPEAIAAESGKKAIETEKKPLDRIFKTKNEKKAADSKTNESEKEEKVDYQLDRAIDILHGIAVYQTRQES